MEGREVDTGREVIPHEVRPLESCAHDGRAETMEPQFDCNDSDSEGEFHFEI